MPEIIIIGGGAVGCGVAYSLAKAGKTDLLLLEKEPTVAAAITPQAAGLVGQVRNSVERTRLAMWSVETFSEMERGEESGVGIRDSGEAQANACASPTPDSRLPAPGWRQVGSLRVSLCDERDREFEAMKRVADEAGLEVEFIDHAAAKTRWPMMRFDRVQSVLWCPSDGYLQPSDLCMAYVARARQLGAQFRTNTAVKQVLVKNGRVTGVETNKGTIECDTVINAAGAHAYHVAKSVGVELPIVPVRHEYFVTIEADGATPEMPVVRIPDATLYVRPEVNSLLCGGWEPNGNSLDPRGYPLADDPPPISPDWDVLGEFAAQLAPEIPQVEELGVRSVFKGWPTFTPDGRFLIGECAQVKGFVMAGGCNAHGVSGSAGIGRHVVESMLETDPSPYVKSLSPNRFAEGSWDWETVRRDAQRKYETYYGLG